MTEPGRDISSSSRFAARCPGRLAYWRLAPSRMHSSAMLLKRHPCFSTHGPKWPRGNAALLRSGQRPIAIF